VETEMLGRSASRAAGVLGLDWCVNKSSRGNEKRDRGEDRLVPRNNLLQGKRSGDY